MDEEYTREEIELYSSTGYWKGKDEVLLKWADLIAESSSRTQAVDTFARWLHARDPASSLDSWPLGVYVSQTLSQELFTWSQIPGNKLWDSEVLQEMIAARAAGDPGATQTAWNKLSKEWRILALKQPIDEQRFWGKVHVAASRLIS
jgi:hypothetical protein